jgi:hypothetical protein
VIKGHHDWFNIFQRWEDFDIGEVVADEGVITAVQAVRGARTSVERVEAVGLLVERIG